jgi:hypothetical protein
VAKAEVRVSEAAVAQARIQVQQSFLAKKARMFILV